MKKVYTHENRMLVWNLKNILEDARIECHIKNEFLAGGVGELVPTESWPELWVVNDDDFLRAMEFVNKQIDAQGHDQVDWRCPHCDEENGSNFEVCWKCGVERKIV